MTVALKETGGGEGRRKECSGRASAVLRVSEKRKKGIVSDHILEEDAPPTERRGGAGSGERGQAQYAFLKEGRKGPEESS